MTGRIYICVMVGVVGLLGVDARGADVSLAPGQSIQAAIDTAPEGATIALAAGIYDESLTITKAITIVGAGWEKTIVGPEKPGKISRSDKDKLLDRLEATTDPQQRARIAMELAAVATPPSITVRSAKGVTIRNLRVRGPRSGGPDGLTGDSLVVFDGARDCALIDAAVIGPAANGIIVNNGSDVRIEKSLIAAVWGTGVAAGSSKLHLADSDVRSCYHRCVTIGRDQGSVIERCRISGSAWHGIRYDHCSPTIKDNQIFGNARSGIYASGNTAANVTGNVFWRNEMGAMSCWFNNADNVEGNTIVGNLREGISVLGNSKTKLTKNVFAGNAVGVSCGQINGDGESKPSPVLSGNVFWDNPENFQMLGKPAELPAGNGKAAPTFASVEQHDFSLPADSPARKLGAGAAQPIAFAGPFPVTAEETAMLPDTETRDFASWKKPEAEAKPAAAAEGPSSRPSDDKTKTTAATPEQLKREKGNASARMQQDRRRFPRQDIADAEALYQVANKNWRSAEAKESLQKMIAKYPQYNRTGCGILYLGQMSEGDERVKYLTEAVEKHSDCYYMNGVQVGAFGRYLLAHTYLDQGKNGDAQKLFDEIRKDYSNAVTHRGDSLIAVMNEEGKSMKAGTQPTAE